MECFCNGVPFFYLSFYERPGGVGFSSASPSFSWTFGLLPVSVSFSQKVFHKIFCSSALEKSPPGAGCVWELSAPFQHRFHRLLYPKSLSPSSAGPAPAFSAINLFRLICRPLLKSKFSYRGSFINWVIKIDRVKKMYPMIRRYFFKRDSIE